ncbi:lysylphosphatidylglycerol synthase transmembrane domain-containing protein [Bacillus marinisedimentorum]|uniref:lysylphosphatidylglycerol synthase transmembrane domain-containing protein n=1 Tax=Bacillus marinisedimentorum TaxID=1821260 RepID=UPI000872E30B|nr:lysylphosphatidylglycerol synthase transmembrane domain-containing protein [Bacillus marinisedimentorum]
MGNRIILVSVGIILTVTFAGLSLRFFDFHSLLRAGKLFLGNPLSVAAVFAAYTGAFLLRAWAHYLYIGRRASYTVLLQGIGYSLFINHLVPVKVGDAARVGYIMKKGGLKGDDALHSVAVLRGLDMAVLIFFAGAGLVVFQQGIRFTSFFLAAGGVAFILIAAAVLLSVRNGKIKRLAAKQVQLLKEGMRGIKGAAAVSMIALSWILEAAVIFEIARTGWEGLSFGESVFANSLTVGGQVFQIAPGGLATYESMMTFALAITGVPASFGYQAAILSHLFKFAFSYLTGFLLLLTAPVAVIDLKQWTDKRRGNR